MGLRIATFEPRKQQSHQICKRRAKGTQSLDASISEKDYILVIYMQMTNYVR